MRPSMPAHPEDDRLLELAYGEMPASEAKTLRQHVDGCARCRGVLDGYAEVRSAFRSVPAEPAPERGLDSLLAYGEKAAARARSRRVGLRILGLLSAAAALTVVWLVGPASHREADGLARAPEAKSGDRVARLDTPQASPEQGNGVRDEADREKKPMAPAPPVATELAQKELPKMEAQTAPGRRAADAKRKEVAKLDAADKAAADAPAELRAEVSKDRAAGASGLLGAGAGPSPAFGGAVASSGAAGLKKSAGAEKSGGDTFRQLAPGAPAPASAPPPIVARASPDDVRAHDAAKAVATPVAEALASAERGRVSSDLAPLQPSRPVAKTSPIKGAANVTEPMSRSLSMPAARAGLGSPDQQARLAEIVQKLETAKGDERKALMMERCELEARMERRPDAVLSCSKVTQEFPGTPEAARASEIARGFSVQPAPQNER